MSDKQKIAQTFGEAAARYQAHATLQRDCAVRLLDLLEHHAGQWQMPLNQILEVGCGTGFLTQGLRDRFPAAPILATDLSVEMVTFCQQQLGGGGGDRVSADGWGTDYGGLFVDCG